jgi:hypothetical protein
MDPNVFVGMVFNPRFSPSNNDFLRPTLIRTRYCSTRQILVESLPLQTLSDPSNGWVCSFSMTHDILFWVTLYRYIVRSINRSINQLMNQSMDPKVFVRLVFNLRFSQSNTDPHTHETWFDSASPG